MQVGDRATGELGDKSSLRIPAVPPSYGTRGIDLRQLGSSMSEQQAVHLPWLRPMLKVLMVVGFVLMLIGPVARIGNEGFGDVPGPIGDSDYWQQVAYVLIPAGISVILLAGLALVVADRRRRQK